MALSSGSKLMSDIYYGVCGTSADSSKVFPKASYGLVSLSFKEKNSWTATGTNANKSFPSMNIASLDPPFTDFRINGKTFNRTIFENERRSLCSKNSTDCCLLESGVCNNKYIPGANVMYLFSGALGIVRGLAKNKVVESNSSEIPGSKEFKYSEPNTNNPSSIVEQCTFDSNKILYSENSYSLSNIDINWLSKNYPKYSNYELWPTLQILFVDNDAPDWKKYWVKYVIINELSKFVGVKFTFYHIVNGEITDLGEKYGKLVYEDTVLKIKEDSQKQVNGSVQKEPVLRLQMFEGFQSGGKTTDIWSAAANLTGSDGAYPRPQGNLNMFEYGLKEDAQKELESFYRTVLQ